MVGKLLVMRLVSAIFVLSSGILTSSTHTCKNKTFNDKKLFAKCRDLPQLSSYLYWTYDPATGKLNMAFIHAKITTPDRWIAWAINPNNNLKTAMVGAQALVAISQSGGAPTIYTTSITSYSTHLQEGNISYPYTGLAATRQNKEITIYAILTLPIGTTKIVHLWQDGPLSGSTPQAHQLATSNIQAKEILDLNLIL